MPEIFESPIPDARIIRVLKPRAAEAQYLMLRVPELSCECPKYFWVVSGCSKPTLYPQPESMDFQSDEF